MPTRTRILNIAMGLILAAAALVIAVGIIRFSTPPPREPGTSATKLAMHQVAAGLEIYANTQGAPPPMDDWAAALIRADILDRQPTDAWNQPIHASIENDTLTIWSDGQDTLPNTPDDESITLPWRH